MKAARVLLALAVAAGIWYQFSTRPITHPAGIIAPGEPVQENIPGAEPFELGDARVTPLARFSLEARVLGTETYRTGRESNYSSTDLAMGWGSMSDSAVIEKLDITQSGRFYFYTWKGSPPIPSRDIATHSANMHMIPANEEVGALLKRVRTGHVVELRGYLVRLDTPDNWHWKSSLTRSDSGAGACEVVWVEEISVRE